MHIFLKINTHSTGEVHIDYTLKLHLFSKTFCALFFMFLINVIISNKRIKISFTLIVQVRIMNMILGKIYNNNI